VNDSTISANSAHGNGGAIAAPIPTAGVTTSQGSVQLYEVTVAGNVADSDFGGAGLGGGIQRAAGGNTIELWSTLLVENYAANQPNDCAGDPLTSHDYNYIQSTGIPASCTITGTMAHDISAGDALLDALQDNGGTTPTRALLAGSPAIDHIPPALCRDAFGTAPNPDQRGVPRPVGPLCDIGAYEGALPATLYNRNLIRNGAAENGAGSPTGALVGVPNWTVMDGQFTAVPYGSPGGFPDAATDIVPDNHGYNFFAGGNVDVSKANQIIDVSAISTDVAAGAVHYALSAALGGYLTSEDNATLTISFLDGTSNQIGTPVSIGPVTAADRGNTTGFRTRSAQGSVPPATRTIEVEVTLTRADGAYNDGYADDLSLVLVAVCAGLLLGVGVRVADG